MKPEPMLGLELRIVSNLFDRKIHSIVCANGAGDITPMHGRILGYLSCSQKQGRQIYQKDIETAFDITRSTVTSLLKLMEQKGYISREQVDHDARLKRIRLTPQGLTASARIHSSIQQAEALLHDALPADDCERLLGLLERIKAVL